MPVDISGLFAEHEAERFALHARFLNEQIVRVLRTVGYDEGFVRGKGQYLWDRAGVKYLDLVSGFGVLHLGATMRVCTTRFARFWTANSPISSSSTSRLWRASWHNGSWRECHISTRCFSPTLVRNALSIEGHKCDMIAELLESMFVEGAAPYLSSSRQPLATALTTTRVDR